MITIVQTAVNYSAEGLIRQVLFGRSFSFYRKYVFGLWSGSATASTASYFYLPINPGGDKEYKPGGVQQYGSST